MQKILNFLDISLEFSILNFLDFKAVNLEVIFSFFYKTLVHKLALSKNIFILLLTCDVIYYQLLQQTSDNYPG